MVDEETPGVRRADAREVQETDKRSAAEIKGSGEKDPGFHAMAVMRDHQDAPPDTHTHLVIVVLPFKSITFFPRSALN